MKLRSISPHVSFFGARLALLITIVNISLYLSLRFILNQNQQSKIHYTKNVIINNIYLSKRQVLSNSTQWVREKEEENPNHSINHKKEHKVFKPKVPLLFFSTIHNNDLSSKQNYGKNHFKEHSVGRSRNLTKMALPDVYVSVRTTSLFHQTRLSLMLKTWMSLIPEQIRIISDAKDQALEKWAENFAKRKPHFLAFNCPYHFKNKWALLCKLYWELQTYKLQNNKEKWFCHFDDDTYVNVPSLLWMLGKLDSSERIYVGRSPSIVQPTITRVYKPQKNSNQPKFAEIEISKKQKKDPFQLLSFHYAVGGAGYCLSKALADDLAPFLEGSSLIQIASTASLPDDCLLGYIITHLLGVSLTHTDLMNSQYDDLSNLTVHDMLGQITFSVQFRNYANKNKTENSTTSKNEFGETKAGSSSESDRLFVLSFHKELVDNLRKLKSNKSD